MFIFFILNFIPLALFAQRQPDNLEDILNFTINKADNKLVGWRIAAKPIAKLSGKIASEVLENGHKATVFTFSPTAQKIALNIISGFLMPAINDMEEAEVVFYGKNAGFSTMYFLLSGFSTDGEIVSSDTLQIAETSNWDTFATCISVKNVSYMRLQLYVESNGENVGNADRMLGLGQIQLLADGRNLTEYQAPNVCEAFVPDTNCVAKLSWGDLTSYRRATGMTAPKILAIGESIHGSETLSETAIQIIKSRILYNNCKLVLLEIPFEVMLNVNRYVQGDTRFELDTIANSLDLILCSAKILDFFEWVREYNRYAQRKVSVLGMDAPSTSVFSYPSNIYNYFYSLNKDELSDAAKAFLALHLKNCRQAMENGFSLVENDTAFQKNSIPSEMKLIDFWWRKRLATTATVNDEEEVYPLRDSLMFESVRYMTELFCESSETVTLYAHLGHICFDKTHTLDVYPPLSCGSFLKKEYGDEYGAVGLFAYEGEATCGLQELHYAKMETGRLPFFSKIPLQPVDGNHLESLLHRFNSPFFYASVSLFPRRPLYARMKGNATQLHTIFHPYLSMDGAVYVENSEAMHLIHETVSWVDKFKKLVERFERQRALYEIY